MKAKLIALGIVVALMGSGYVFLIAPRQAHARAYDRLQAVSSRNRSTVPPGLEMRDWDQLCGAIPTVLANFFVLPDYFPTERLRTLADQFEARWPQGPKSPADILAMVEAIEAANPKTVGYSWHELVREYVREHDSPGTGNRRK